MASLSHTVGPHNEPVETHQFDYEFNYTIVKDCLGRETTFIFDKNKRVTGILYHRLRRDRFVWGTESEKEGWLQYKQVEGPEGIHHKKTYEYDARGNVTAEHTFGSISGVGHETFNDVSETEQHSLYHEYYPGDFNLTLPYDSP